MQLTVRPNCVHDVDYQLASVMPRIGGRCHLFDGFLRLDIKDGSTLCYIQSPPLRRTYSVILYHQIDLGFLLPSLV